MNLSHVLGLDDPSGAWYLFWSGIGGVLLSAIPLFGGLGLMLRKHICHEKSCFHIGLHPIEGTPFIVCRKHHPNIGENKNGVGNS